jgi:Amt family ammonium transporter
MPFVGLATFILWFGWFGFNPGSTLSALSSVPGHPSNIRFADIVLVTNIAAACGVLGALATIWLRTRKPDIGMACNGAIAALVAITAPSGYVNPWAATIIGFVAGIIVVLGVLAIEKVLDDPVGALSAHGLAGIWGTLACGLFTDPTLATLNGVGEGGFVYTGSLHQLFAQFVAVSASFATVFALSFATFFAIKATIGLRVKPEEESYGLDMAEHGMWGYPEQFMPVPGYEYHQPAPPAGRPAPRPAPIGLGAEGSP